ncbi:MAG: glutamine amidotransferase, partial [Bradyrhizobium sp.]|nr:glutamine amidotransferase [Bradyrhizobium sp.]
MARQLQGQKIAILVTDGFEYVELVRPRKALDDAGARTSVVSPKVDATYNAHDRMRGGRSSCAQQTWPFSAPDEVRLRRCPQASGAFGIS